MFVDEARTAAELDLSALGEVAFARGDVGRLRFAGQRADATGLSYQRYRYYAPELGVFTTPDPLGLAGSSQDIAFVPNATCTVDPLGLWTAILQGPDLPGHGTAIADATGYDAAQGGRVIPTDQLGPGSLAGADKVIVDAHGLPGGVVWSPSANGNTLVDAQGNATAMPNGGGNYDLLDGSAIAARLRDAGFQGGPGSSILLGACNGGTEPKIASHGQSVAQRLSDGTGSPVQAAVANSLNRANAIAGGSSAYVMSPGLAISQVGTAGAGDVVNMPNGAPSPQVPGGFWTTFTPMR